MEIDKLLDELFLMLDNYPDIIKIVKIKEKISEDIINIINEYRLNPTIDNKRKVFNNPLIKEYIESESNLNYLIMEINSKFKRGRSCESNKW